jgi:hypothetical protein
VWEKRQAGRQKSIHSLRAYYEQWFSAGSDFVPRVYLTTSGHIFSCHRVGKRCYQRLVRDPKHPTIARTVCCAESHSLSHIHSKKNSLA